MYIKSATSLRNDYDNIVSLSKSKQEPIFITRNGEGEMVILPIELWERREAEHNMIDMLLKRERNMIAGAKTFSTDEIEAMTEEYLRED
jgi:prevent-host-death family protein